LDSALLLLVIAPKKQLHFVNSAVNPPVGNQTSVNKDIAYWARGALVF
jgi:hypothetical protein